jgi:hypothetical protein
LQTFQKEFLSPLLEINKDGRIKIQVIDDHLVSIIKGASEAMLIAKYKPIYITDPVDSFCLNLNTLLKGIKCISSENFSELDIENNYLEYKDNKIKFNIKLLQSNMIPDAPKISMDAVEKHPIESVVSVTSEDMKEIMRAKAFMPECKKMYLYPENDNDTVFEFGDRELDHKNNIKVTLPSSSTETFTPCIFENSLLDLFFRNKCDKLFKVGARALIVEVEQDNSVLTYLTTKLKK